MKACKFAAILVLVTLVAASTAPAKTLQDYIAQVQQSLTENNVQQMLDLTEALKVVGASYQAGLTAPLNDAGRYGPGESLKVMIGIYQFDALYAAAFKKNQQAAQVLEAQGVLIDKLNLRGKMDISAIFPPELKEILRDPENMTVRDVTRAYAKNAKNFEKMMQEPDGFDVLESSLYGLVVEGLYVITQTLTAWGDYKEATRMLTEKVTLGGGQTSLLASLNKGLELLLNLYLSFDDEKIYSQIVDQYYPEELAYRRTLMAKAQDLLERMRYGVDQQNLGQLSKMISRERAQVVGIY